MLKYAAQECCSCLVNSLIRCVFTCLKSCLALFCTGLRLTVRPKRSRRLQNNISLAHLSPSPPHFQLPMLFDLRRLLKSSFLRVSLQLSRTNITATPSYLLSGTLAAKAVVRRPNSVFALTHGIGDGLCVSACVCVYSVCLLFSKRPASSLASQDKIIRHSEAQSGIIFSHQSLVSCQFEFYSGPGCDASIISLSGGEDHRDRATHFIHLTSMPNGQHLHRFCRNGGHVPAQGSPSAESRGGKKGMKR